MPEPKFRSVKQEVQYLLDLRKDLGVWMESNLAENWINGIVSRVNRQADENLARSLYTAAVVLKQSIRTATPYFVEEELVDVAQAAAAHATFPGYTFSKADMPSPTGFIYLSRPVVFDAEELVEVGGERSATPYNLAVHGFFWDATQTNARGDEKFIAWSLVKPASITDDSRTLAQYPRIFPSGHVVVSFHAQDWTSEQNTPDEEMRLLKVLWLLMGQQLTESKKMLPAKHEIEKAKKKKRPIPTVVVVTLRRMATTTEYDREHSGREYSHRFIVGGHWRTYQNERYSELVRSTPQWISPYVKGDPEKPLVVKDKVYRLAR